MSKTVQLKRGNANVSATYVGAEGEITVNTTDYTLNVHDGVTPGGYIITGYAGANIGNLNFSNQTISGLNANANISINTGNASLAIQGNAFANYFLGNGSLLSGLNTYSNSNVQSLLSNYSSAIINTANITAGYFLGNGALLTGINQAGLGNVLITDQTISGKNEPAQALILGNGNVYMDSANITTARFTSIQVDGSSQFNTIAANNSISALRILSTISMGVVSSNTSTGYYFTPNSNAFTSNTGLSHRNQSLSDPNVSVLALSHDAPVALFFSNGTNQLIGGLVVTGTDRPYGLFPNANVALYANVNSYSQVIHQNLNEGELSSTDYVSTANNGDDTTFYLDMGIAGNLHADPDFFGDTTSYNDAYLYVTAYDQAGPSTGNIGNLIIGSTNGIVKTFVGNTAEANVITVVDTTGFLPGANVVYNLGSPTKQWRDLWLSNSTFYLGGVPITVTGNGQLSVNGSVISGNVGGDYGNANVAAYLPTYTGNIAANIVKNGQSWTFDGTSTGSLTLPASSLITEVANPGGFPGYALSIAPDLNNALNADQKLLVYPTGGQDFNHLHLTTGNLYNTELYLGNDNLYVKLSNTGNVIVNSDDNLGNTAQWTFGADGNLITPDNLVIGGAPGSGTSILQYDAPLQVVGEGANGAVVMGWAANTSTPDSIAIIGFNTPYPNGTGNVIIASGNNATIVNYWNFDNTGNFSAPGNISTTGNISASGNITGNTAGFAIGYRDIPQVVFTSNATLALTDAGKHYFSSNSANVITVPNNSTVSFSIGTAITVVQQGTANLTISPDSGVTMYLSGNSTSAARTLGNYGMATLMKVATDTWFINGTGLE